MRLPRVAPAVVIHARYMPDTCTHCMRRNVWRSCVHKSDRALGSVFQFYSRSNRLACTCFNFKPTPRRCACANKMHSATEPYENIHVPARVHRTWTSGFGIHTRAANGIRSTGAIGIRATLAETHASEISIQGNCLCAQAVCRL